MLERRAYRDADGNPRINGGVMRNLFHEDTEEDYACRVYATRCLVHRLRKFGWEPSVNTLDSRSLLLLGASMGGEPGQRIVEEGIRKQVGAPVRVVWTDVDAPVRRV